MATRTLRFIAAASLVMALTVLGSPASKSKRKRPHIVFILGDDVGWADVSFHGASQIPTPNLDALAADGAVLNNYYVQPLCSPSRAALMSGYYPFRTGMQHSAIYPPEPRGLPLNLKLMPEYFRDLGYETHMIGKWHLGYYKSEYTPLRRGFDSFYGFFNGELDYYNHTVDSNGAHSGLDFWLNSEPLRGETGNYTTYLFTERARHVITTRDPNKPLFLYVSSQAAHYATGSSPLQAPEEHTRKFPYIGERNRTIFAGMIDAMDQSVGHIVEFLSDAGMLDNTIIVYSSDNGGTPFGDHASRGFNWPLRGSKASLWEGGVRAASFVWSPLLKKSPRAAHQMMHVVDWLPTLYSAAGGNAKDLGDIDGVDIWHQLTNDLPSKRSEIVLNIDPIENCSAIRHGNYKLVLGISQNGLYDQRLPVPGESRPYPDLDTLMKHSRAAAVLKRYHRTKQFVFAKQWRQKATVNCGTEDATNFVGGKPPYLFDMENDPCELNNLAEAKPQLVQLLSQKIYNYAATQAPPLNQPNDPQSYPEYHNGLWVPWED